MDFLDFLKKSPLSTHPIKIPHRTTIQLLSILFFLMGGYGEGMAQKTTRTIQVQGGIWDGTGSIWDNGAPEINDIAIISTNSSIIFNTNISSVNRLGTLIIENGASLDMPSGTLNTNLLTLDAGSTLSLSGGNISANGQTNINGSILGTINNNNLYEFTGGVTIGNGGTFNVSSNADIVFSGPLSNNGTFTQNGGGTITLGGVNTITPNQPITFTGNTSIQNSDMTIQGSAALTFQNNVTITGVTVTNTNANVSIQGVLQGSGTWVNGANSQLTFAGGGISTAGFNASAVGNRVIYNANAAQAVFPGTYHHLTLAGSNTKTLTGTLTLNGNLTANSAFTVSGASTFSGGNTISGTGVLTLQAVTIQGNVINQSTNLGIQGNLSGTGTWFNDVNSVLNYGGNFEPVPTLDVDQSGNTFNYNGANQTIKPAAYFHLSMSGTNAVSGANSTLTVLGNWTNTGTFNPGTSTVVFNGSNTQLLTRNAGRESFTNLSVNSDVDVSNGATVTGTLNLQGILRITNDTLVLNALTNVQVGSGNFFVEGWVRKNGLTDFTFPLGANGFKGNARLFGFTGDYAMRYFQSAPPNVDADSELFFISHKEYWEARSIGAGSSGKIELFWENGTRSEITTLSDLRIAYWDATAQKWLHAGEITHGTAPGPGSIESNSLTNLGVFTFGSAKGENSVGSPIVLPNAVSLVSVSPDETNQVLITWTTNDTRYTSTFEIERSEGDSDNFITNPKLVQEISRDQLTFTDATAKPGKVYFYRVYARNIFGTSPASNVLGVVISGLEDNELGRYTEVYPNPTTESIQLKVNSFQNDALSWKILDIQGKMLRQSTSSHTSSDHRYRIDFSTLPGGTYFLVIHLGNASTVKKIVKE